MPEGTKMQHDSTARVALEMAQTLWFNEHGTKPTLKDEQFVALVSTCANALKGSYKGFTWN